MSKVYGSVAEIANVLRRLADSIENEGPFARGGNPWALHRFDHFAAAGIVPPAKATDLDEPLDAKYLGTTFVLTTMPLNSAILDSINGMPRP